jgi:hypothetical protein
MKLRGVRAVMYMFSTVLFSREPIGQKYRTTGWLSSPIVGNGYFNWEFSNNILGFSGNYSAQQRTNLSSGTIRGNLETLAPKWSHASVYAWLWLQDKTPWTVKRSI